MRQKKNDNSPDIKDWTNKKLKQEASEYYDLIYGFNPCYGSHDIQIFDTLTNELYKRGINSKISFN